MRTNSILCLLPLLFLNSSALPNQAGNINAEPAGQIIEERHLVARAQNFHSVMLDGCNSASGAGQLTAGGFTGGSGPAGATQITAAGATQAPASVTGAASAQNKKERRQGGSPRTTGAAPNFSGLASSGSPQQWQSAMCSLASAREAGFHGNGGGNSLSGGGGVATAVSTS